MSNTLRSEDFREMPSFSVKNVRSWTKVNHKIGIDSKTITTVRKPAISELEPVTELEIHRYRPHRDLSIGVDTFHHFGVCPWLRIIISSRNGREWQSSGERKA
nr:hypothetical protein H0235_001720 [Vespula pensylvanica]